MARKKITINEDGETEIEQENIIVQLRKVINLRGLKPLTFIDGNKSPCTVGDAQVLLATYESLKTTAEKDIFARKMSKSAASLGQLLQTLPSTNAF